MIKLEVKAPWKPSTGRFIGREGNITVCRNMDYTFVVPEQRDVVRHPPWQWQYLINQLLSYGPKSIPQIGGDHMV